MDEPELLSTGQVAEILGMQTWRIQHMFDRGLTPEPRRFGRFRMFTRADVPVIEAAARKAGYPVKPTRAELQPA